MEEYDKNKELDLTNKLAVHTDRQGLKGGGTFNPENPEELDMRIDGWRPTNEQLKTKFDKNKKRYLKDLS